MKRILLCALALLSLGATASTNVPVQLLNPAGSTSGQVVTSNGATSAPTWQSLPVTVTGLTAGTGISVSAATGNVTVSLASIAANSLLGNSTASSAAPAAVAVTGCNGAAQALQWTSGTGFGCNSNIATSGANANITSLTGLTTPLGTWAGGLGANNTSANGIPVFSSGTATVTTTPNLGTPSAVTLTNGTGLPISTGVSGLGTGVASALGSAVTGSGGIALANSPTITTPNTRGVTNGGSAAAGQVGEIISGSAASVSLTSGTPANCTSISLTAGDWDVWGNVQFVPAGTTVTSAMQVGLNTTTAALPSTTFQGILQFSSTGVSQAVQAPMQIINVASTTTVYLVAQATFTTSTETVSCQMAARRMH